MPSLVSMSAVVAVLALAQTPLMAQSDRRGGDRAMQIGARDTVTGTVIALDTMSMDDSAGRGPGPGRHGQQQRQPKHEQQHRHSGPGMMGGTHARGGLALRLAVASDTIAVHLGPLWYLAIQNPDGFRVGDELTVDGAEMRDAAHPHWMAYAITKGDLEVALRDDQGRPRWWGAMHMRHHADHRGPGRTGPQ